MDDLAYQKLYALQDKAMAVLFAVEKEFYLTGGTCLSRFYQAKRYSEDLDFFANVSSRFAFAVRSIRQAWKEQFDLQTEVEGKEYFRFRINGVLQVDFVNDLTPHQHAIRETEAGYLIDSVENILSNKITAVISRDSPKDVFDIYLIAKFYEFSWGDILAAAHKKAFFADEELLVRLKSFPSSLLSTIKLIDKNFLDNFDVEFPLIIDKLISHLHHTA